MNSFKFWRARLLFEPRDLWVGIFWDKGPKLLHLRDNEQIYHIYICLIPCLPIKITFSRIQKITLKTK